MSVTLEAPRMARKQGGRPSKIEGPRPTEQVRVFADLARKINDLVDLLYRGKGSAILLDDIIRPDIEEMWAKRETAIKQMRQLDAQKDRIRKQAEMEGSE